MKKLFCSLALILGILTTAEAQQAPLRMRAEVGANISSFMFPGGWAKETPNKLGFRADVGLEARLHPAGLYAYGALGYRHSAGAKSVLPMHAAMDGGSIPEATFDLHYGLAKAGIGFRFALGRQAALSLEAGSYYGQVLKGDCLLEYSRGDRREQYAISDAKNPFRCYQLGVAGAISLEYSRLYLRAGIEQGLTNDFVMQSEHYTAKNRNLYLSFGFYL